MPYKAKYRAGEMAQWVIALAALSEDPGSVPTIPMTSVQFQDSQALFWLSMVPGMHKICSRSCGKNIYTHEIHFKKNEDVILIHRTQAQMSGKLVHVCLLGAGEAVTGKTVWFVGQSS